MDIMKLKREFSKHPPFPNNRFNLADNIHKNILAIATINGLTQLIVMDPLQLIIFSFCMSSNYELQDDHHKIVVAI